MTLPSNATPEQREKQKAYVKAWRAKNPDRKREQSRRSQQKVASDHGRDFYRTKSLKSKFGMTHIDLEAIVSDQGGRCAICMETLKLGAGSHAVDHCHTSGAVRGVLCLGCNVGLGNFKDSPLLLQAAIRYLGNPKEHPWTYRPAKSKRSSATAKPHGASYPAETLPRCSTASQHSTSTH